MSGRVSKMVVCIGADKINNFVIKQALGDDYYVVFIDTFMEATKKIDALIGRSNGILCVSQDFDPNIQLFAKDYVSRGYVTSIPLVAVLPEKICENCAHSAYEIGFTEVISQPFDPFYLRAKLDALHHIYFGRHSDSGDDPAEEKLSKVIVNILSSVFEFIQFEPADHITRSKEITRILTLQFADMFPEYELDDEDIDYISKAAALHDIGKAAIPPSILFKAGKLTDEEFDIMKSHTIKGEEILKKFGLDRSHRFFNFAFDMCKYHHERWDGSGYPEHLEGEQIPVSAQIYSLVDAYNALIAERVYKDVIPYDKTLAMIREGKCGMFPPKVLEAFNACEEKIKDYLQKSLNLVLH